MVLMLVLRRARFTAHQTFDNYLTSEILRSRNPTRAVNLARLKTETYVDIKDKSSRGESSFGTAVQAIFKDGKPDLTFYQGILHDLEKGTYPLPAQSRDIFLFLPYEILRIFPTILSFSSRNLYFSDGKAEYSNGSREPLMKILEMEEKKAFHSNLMKAFVLIHRVICVWSLINQGLFLTHNYGALQVTLGIQPG